MSKRLKQYQLSLLFPTLFPWKTNKYFCLKKIKSIIKTCQGCVFQLKWKDESLGMFIDMSSLTVSCAGCDFHSLLAACRKAITPVTWLLINESFNSSEEGPWPFQASVVYSPSTVVLPRYLP